MNLPLLATDFSARLRRIFNEARHVKTEAPTLVREACPASAHDLPRGVRTCVTQVQIRGCNQVAMICQAVALTACWALLPANL